MVMNMYVFIYITVTFICVLFAVHMYTQDRRNLTSCICTLHFNVHSYSEKKTSFTPVTSILYT